MKRCLKFLSLMIVVVFISGCGNDKEVTKTCTLTSTDKAKNLKLETEYKVYGKGKTADKVVTTEIITTDDEDTLNYYKEYLEKTYSAANKAYGGYTINVTKEDNKVVSETTIDYNKMNLKDFVKDNSIMKNYVDKNNKMLIDGLVSTYEALGATCK